VLYKPIESEPIEIENVSEYTSIWKICTGGKFSVKISGNFWKNRNKFPEIFRRKFPEIS